MTETAQREATFTVRLKYMERKGQPLGPPVDARVAAEELALLYRRSKEGEREVIEARGKTGRALAAGNYTKFLQMIEEIVLEDTDDSDS